MWRRDPREILIIFDNKDRTDGNNRRASGDRSHPCNNRTRPLNRTARTCLHPYGDDANNLANNSRKGIKALPPWQRLPQRIFS